MLLLVKKPKIHLDLYAKIRKNEFNTKCVKMKKINKMSVKSV